MSQSTNIHVILRYDIWVVRREDTFRPTSVHETQREAIDIARKMARAQNGQLVIHGRNGRVRKRTIYHKNTAPRRPPEVLFPKFRASRSKKEIEKAVLAVMKKLENGSRSSPRTAKR
jgi:hypothetical protein